MLKVSICGIGNFGFALLKHLSQPYPYTRDFILYAYDTDQPLMENLRANRTHLLHHRDVKISKKVVFPDNPEQLIKNADILILAVTSTGVKDVMAEFKPFINRNLIIVNTAKALSEDGRRLSEVILDSLQGIKYQIAISTLAGGTIAYDLFKHEPLGIDIASHDKATLTILKDIFTTDNLRVYITDDLEGTEYAAAFKNVISILAGVVKGLGFSYGSQTHMISRAAEEVKQLVTTKLGGKEKTFSMGSQCWGNDLWMSCTGNTRNREFGTLLGKGLRVDEAIAQMQTDHKTIEGINTLRIIEKIIGEEAHKYPILDNINKIVSGQQNARMIILGLMRSSNI
jgi:glycerol-3-phosphate dehydrogenase (NAD(P)+)